MGCGTAAFAQYGLYGSPEMVPLQPNAAAPGNYGYASPPAYPTAPPVYSAMRSEPVLPAYASLTPGRTAPGRSHAARDAGSARARIGQLPADADADERRARCGRRQPRTERLDPA